MKMKINKACDLSSISVLPHARRSSGVLPPGPPQSSQQLRSQASQQLRSQASQQSFSQGHSSQPGMFSQLSQSSLEEAVMADQRLNSQEREPSVKRISCLAPTAYKREETQMPMSRSSTALMHKWNPTTFSDHRCRISEELEHKIGVIETSMNKFGMILDSIQSDIMQANKGTKEISLEYGIRQKLTSSDNLLQLMSKGQADLKGSLDDGLKSIRNLLSKNVNQDRVKETLFTLSALPERIEAYILKTKRDLCNAFTAELKEISCNLKNSHKKCIDTGFHPPKDNHCSAASKKRPQPVKMNYSVKRRTKECTQTGIAPKIEMGKWTSVKREQNTLKDRNCTVKYKQKSFPPIQQENAGGRLIESDEDIAGGLSFLLEENDSGARSYLVEEARMDTKRILREARTRKRKYSNPIIID